MSRKYFCDKCKEEVFVLGGQQYLYQTQILVQRLDAVEECSFIKHQCKGYSLCKECAENLYQTLQTCLDTFEEEGAE